MLGNEALRRLVLGADILANAATAVSASGMGHDGLLISLLPDAEDRLQFFATAMGVALEPCVAKLDGCEVTVPAWLAPGAVGPEAMAAAAEIMALRGLVPVARIAARRGSIEVAAASRLRARQAVQRSVRRGSGEVVTEGRAVPHAGFFGLEVLTLRYRRFDGKMSGAVQREVFMSGDAVTVLPYDPARDRVLLIEQVRLGPIGRGDPLPWQLEAIAGRIDPGETPEACARREALEEAGLVLGRLEKVAEYYPSPGALSEYLYSYVTLCDLPDGVAGVFGLAAEAEDIRGHLMSFDDFMALVAAGEVANAPLLLTALWLQRERARLRG
jgi:nudix-type nucleoside diphosphatase (YffH/AdpP family)